MGAAVRAAKVFFHVYVALVAVNLGLNASRIPSLFLSVSEISAPFSPSSSASSVEGEDASSSVTTYIQAQVTAYFSTLRMMCVAVTPILAMNVARMDGAKAESRRVFGGVLFSLSLAYLLVCLRLDPYIRAESPPTLLSSLLPAIHIALSLSAAVISGALASSSPKEDRENNTRTGGLGRFIIASARLVGAFLALVNIMGGYGEAAGIIFSGVEESEEMERLRWTVACMLMIISSFQLSTSLFASPASLRIVSLVQSLFLFTAYTFSDVYVVNAVNAVHTDESMVERLRDTEGIFSQPPQFIDNLCLSHVGFAILSLSLFFSLSLSLSTPTKKQKTE